MSYSLNPGFTPVEYLPLTSGQKYTMIEMMKINRPGWYTIELLLKTKAPMNMPAMKEAIYYLIDKYESLRVRILDRNGERVQEVYPLDAADPFTSFDLSNEDHNTRMETMKKACIKERDGFRPEKGNLIRIIFFRFSEKEGRLWLCLHHVISDFGSVFILSSELLATYNQILQGGKLKWERVIEYRKWLYLVEGYLRDTLLPAELGYWISRPWDKVKFLPSDRPDIFHTGNGIADKARNIKAAGSFRSNTYWIGQQVTMKLFAKFGADFENFLIALVFLSIAKQRKVDCLHINACNSGRHILPAEYGINIYKLLGYLALTKALVLEDPDTGDWLTDVQDVLEQVKDIPNGGIGFYQLEAQIKNEMEKSGDFGLTTQSEIYFNYLGRVESNLDDQLYELAEEDTGLNLYEREIHGVLMELLVGVVNNRMFFNIFFCEGYLTEASIEKIVNNLQKMAGQIVAESLIEN
jgi:non-ribosomal peptide synthase protein (TIGR01720 family)